MLLNLANDRPLTGGGFGAYSDPIYAKYNPSYTGDRYAAHSIYFQVLGEHGWVAFFLFVLFWALVWRMCRQVARLAQGQPDHHWAYWLAQMVKVSMVAYLVGGAFLNLAYWDVPYYLFVAIAITRSILRQAEAKEPAMQIASTDTDSRASAIFPISPAALSSVSEQRDR
jgi:probable O-glycosylation ligase (exosortase A-associated)